MVPWSLQAPGLALTASGRLGSIGPKFVPSASGNVAVKAPMFIVLCAVGLPPGAAGFPFPTLVPGTPRFVWVTALLGLAAGAAVFAIGPVGPGIGTLVRTIWTKGRTIGTVGKMIGTTVKIVLTKVQIVCTSVQVMCTKGKMVGTDGKTICPEGQMVCTAGKIIYTTVQIAGSPGLAAAARAIFVHWRAVCMGFAPLLAHPASQDAAASVFSLGEWLWLPAASRPSTTASL